MVIPRAKADGGLPRVNGVVRPASNDLTLRSHPVALGVSGVTVDPEPANSFPVDYPASTSTCGLSLSATAALVETLLLVAP